MSSNFNIPFVFSWNPYLPVSPCFSLPYAAFLTSFRQAPNNPLAYISCASTTSAALTSSPQKKKTYKRTWKLPEVERLYSLCKDYCQTANKSLESLKLEDFEIISKLTTKSSIQCMTKFVEIRSNGTIRSGVWSAEEDKVLVTHVQNGYKCGKIADILNKEFHDRFKIRTGKQCKERWNNHLNPEMNRGAWTIQEDLNLIETHLKYGNKWTKVSNILRNRTESSIKNRIKSLVNKAKQELNNLNTPQAILERLLTRLRSETLLVSIDPLSKESAAETPYKKKCIDTTMS